jgi:hypothetical protein
VGIWVHSKPLRTAEGIGVGSTAGELQRAYGARLKRPFQGDPRVQALVTGEGVLGFYVVDSHVFGIEIAKNTSDLGSPDSDGAPDGC